jgi:hypothetical protein
MALRIQLLALACGSAVAAGCAQEGAVPHETCSADAPCSSGVCMQGWCMEVITQIAPSASTTRRCAPCTSSCPATDLLDLKLETQVQPSDLAKAVALSAELSVDGVLWGTPRPANITCGGLAEGEHVVTGGVHAGGTFIAADPVHFIVDRTAPALAAVSPDPSAPLTAAARASLRFSEPFVRCTARARRTNDAYESFASCDQPSPGVAEFPLPGPGGTGVTVLVDVTDGAGNAYSGQLTWSYGP